MNRNHLLEYAYFMDFEVHESKQPAMLIYTGNGKSAARMCNGQWI
jgi:hypothetical protein